MILLLIIKLPEIERCIKSTVDDVLTVSLLNTTKVAELLIMVGTLYGRMCFKSVKALRALHS